MTYNPIDNFFKYTNYDLEKFFDRFENFISFGRSDIISFYSGVVEKPNLNSFEEFFSLKEEVDRILNLFTLNSNNFIYNMDWLLLQNVEDIKISLQNLANTYKFFKTTRTENSFKNSTKTTQFKKKNQSIERFSKDSLKTNDELNDWVKIAIDNNLFEEDYEVDEIKELSVFNTNKSSNSVISVIYDNLEGERMYGLDLSRSINLVDDDLEVLSYIETAKQSSFILINLRKGDIPEFSNLGLDLLVLLGNNKNSILVPSIVRQLTSIFNTDDSFSGFEVERIYNEKDSYFIEFSVKTKYELAITELMSL